MSSTDIAIRIALVVTLALGFAAAVVLAVRLRRVQDERDHLDRVAKELSSRVQSLSRFQQIEDAEAWAVNIRNAAEQDAANVTAQAQSLAAQWAEASAAVHAQAQAAATQRLEQASNESAQILRIAQDNAKQIAGDAFAAKENAERYQRTVESMRNVLEGYGDRYILPVTGLLDELAEQFGFAESGQELKAARENTRRMIQSETAATCDYVEANRRATAITFVVNAFNGKVDSILSDVKHDNFGTLQRKITDAYNLVNHNGAAFRNARILPEYLKARQQELRWAVVAQELRLKEREEQRELKERIREEERAQREFERAMKDAQKEEELIRKAMEKAQREIEKASDEQKAKYEGQLAALAEKLRAAEEKNQRALSMAQQTRSGHVYVISNIGSFGEQVFKIGMTRRLEPLDRVRELGDASVPFEFDVHAMIASDDAPTLERALHKSFLRHQMNKVNPRKEFFRVGLTAIRSEVEKCGVQAAWTMTAACREWQETQAIERAMAKESFNERTWEEQQLRERDAIMEETDGAVAVA